MDDLGALSLGLSHSQLLPSVAGHGVPASPPAAATGLVSSKVLLNVVEEATSWLSMLQEFCSTV